MKLLQLFALMLFISINSILGQADTVVVPADYQGDPLGAINRFILGDTTDTGARVNPERYYKLERNKIYFLNGELHTPFDLRLIADPPDAENKPAIVASTTGADGKPQLIQFQLEGDGYIKNILFQMTPPGGQGESNASFFLAKEGGNYYFDNVKWEWGLWEQVVAVKPVNKIVVKNCYFRNPQHKTNIYNGRGVGFYLENPADTVIMVNNTFFNMNSFAFVADNGSIPPKFFRFDHNTIVNEMKWPIHSYWITNAHVTNNLFYNVHSFGETKDDIVGQDPDKLVYGIIDIAPIPSDILDLHGITENQRKYYLKNNSFFYSQEIKDYWNFYDLPFEPWMNSRTKNMFDNDAEYPELVEENTYNLDPRLVEAGTGTTEMIKWMKRKRDWQNNKYWGWDPDGDKFAVQWPFPEDLSYANDTLLKGAEGGFPVGDLNWYPDKKAEWEAWEPSATKEINYKIIKDVKINKVFPNPFKDQINIDYTLEKNTQIDILIYDIIGNKIATIYTGRQGAGNHLIHFDFSKQNIDITCGYYFYKIRTNTSLISGKIEKLK